ncbi:hypothetical protein [Pseudoalteromonas denitrificans]|uniref:Uncharacterized protein n=1 Tax=Pseudoalteromonas denitrificans DSM 6059 TaxID=1123010 RepID=A0A1I1UEH6_9GAMM|nr:hypothetical protein [Pseudoalteromonas denitrificans]SFD69252.1 hypothetical protein SAMN02745724_05213 [Pseudoalteromonas denitrificans DSM 6059]
MFFKTLLPSGFLFLCASFNISAEPDVLFDAEKQCKARETMTGMRYTPPCSISDIEVELGSSDSILDIYMKKFPLNNEIAYQFNCQSLRPFSLKYKVMNDDDVLHTGRFSPKFRYSEDDGMSKLQLSNLLPESKLKLTSAEGLSGFQALKPGCKLTLEVIDNIDAEILNLVTISLGNIENITDALTGTSSYSSLMHEMNNSMVFLTTIEQFVAFSDNKILIETLAQAKLVLEDNDENEVVIRNQVKDLKLETIKKLESIQTYLTDNMARFEQSSYITEEEVKIYQDTLNFINAL